MISIKRIPDFVDRMAFEDDDEQTADVDDQVAPYQAVTSPVDKARLHGCEDVYQLEKQ